jgi:sugar porter (SP) family MFS transporter
MKQNQLTTLNDQPKNTTLYLVIVCFAAALGGFLFGFDTAVASGTIGFLRDQFSLSPVMEGWVMSSALFGSIGGAAIAGWLSDRYGRKIILILSAVLFFISALWCSSVNDVVFLVIARLVGGFGVGIAAMVAPMYISELAPPGIRGRLVSFYQMAITFGILMSYLSNTALLNYATEHIGEIQTSFFGLVFVDEVWRAMFGSEIFPAMIFLIMLFIVPKSPRWLAKEGKMEQAGQILTRFLGKEEADHELLQIKQTIAQKQGSYRDLLKPGIRAALVVGVLLSVFNQLTGITSVMYYAPTIFENAGFQSGSAFGSAIIIGFVNMIFTLFAIWKIDKFGRRPLLITGFVFVGIILISIGICFMQENPSPVLLLSLFIMYIMFFAAALGPTAWVIPSEIYPTHIRGRAMSISTLVLFVGSTVVTQTFPWLRENIGMGSTFILYGLLMIPAVWFAVKLVPETKGKTLEEIEKDWKRKANNP